jgi:hypothetical protein
VLNYDYTSANSHSNSNTHGIPSSFADAEPESLSFGDS